MRFQCRLSGGWPLYPIIRRNRATGMRTGRRVRAMALAMSLTGSALGAVTLGTVTTAGPALAV